MSIIIQAFQQIFRPEGSPFLITNVMDLLFRGVNIDCNREELEASVVCPQMGNEKGIHKINDTFYSVSLFGAVSSCSGRFAACCS